MEETDNALVKRIRQVALSVMLASTLGASPQHAWSRLSGLRYERPVRQRHICCANLLCDVPSACAFVMGALSVDEQAHAVYLMTSHHETTAIRLFEYDGSWFCCYVLVGADRRSNTLVCGMIDFPFDAEMSSDEAHQRIRAAMRSAVFAGLMVHDKQPTFLINE